LSVVAAPDRGLPRCSISVPPLIMSRLSLLMDLSALLGREVDLDSLLGTACERMAEALRADRASIWLVDADRGDLVTRVARLPELAALRQPLDRGLAGHVATTGETLRVDDAALDARFDPSADRATGYTTRSMLVAPIREQARGPVRGVVQLLNRADGPFDEEDARYLEALAAQLARALSLTTLRAAERSEPGVTVRGRFNHIVGQSSAMQAVYTRIGLAAQTDATVFLRGETGTGKGLLARAIHVNSPRQAGPLVTVDCTTLPGQLVESELFGHERGAFTGADRRVRGKVEMAEGGTLFLDEIGELSLESQAKLLRFLQERCFERVGGRETLSSDVRIICASHRDLERAIEERAFRQDLYFRIRVVTIDVPPLRVRGTDEIQVLARHFAELYAARYGRPQPRIDEAALAALGAHDWPGNVRELEHWMESAVVLAPDGRIGEELLPQSRRSHKIEGHVTGSSETQSPHASGSDRGVLLPVGLTLDEASRRYVEATLLACDGNKTEAARRLNVGRNTVARAIKARREEP
jgi:transcriptional regulator with GAF, ATPase, and Fis domain